MKSIDKLLRKAAKAKKKPHWCIDHQKWETEKHDTVEPFKNWVEKEDVEEVDRPSEARAHEQDMTNFHEHKSPMEWANVMNRYNTVKHVNPHLANNESIRDVPIIPWNYDKLDDEVYGQFNEPDERNANTDIERSQKMDWPTFKQNHMANFLDTPDPYTDEDFAPALPRLQRITDHFDGLHAGTISNKPSFASDPDLSQYFGSIENSLMKIADPEYQIPFPFQENPDRGRRPGYRLSSSGGEHISDMPIPRYRATSGIPTMMNQTINEQTGEVKIDPKGKNLPYTPGMDQHWQHAQEARQQRMADAERLTQEFSDSADDFERRARENYDHLGEPTRLGRESIGIPIPMDDERLEATLHGPGLGTSFAEQWGREMGATNDLDESTSRYIDKPNPDDATTRRAFHRNSIEKALLKLLKEGERYNPDINERKIPPQHTTTVEEEPALSEESVHTNLRTNPEKFPYVRDRLKTTDPDRRARILDRGLGTRMTRPHPTKEGEHMKWPATLEESLLKLMK